MMLNSVKAFSFCLNHTYKPYQGGSIEIWIGFRIKNIFLPAIQCLKTCMPFVCMVQKTNLGSRQGFV
jgi:hypothetical protein